MIFFCIGVFFCVGIKMIMAQKPIQIPVDSTPLVINTKKGAFSYNVEIAFLPAQSNAGLMYRTHFPKNHAMLFKNSLNNTSENTQEMFMWMANTPLPLDMIFLNSEGIIVSIVENTRIFSEDIISSKVPATFAIELNAGEVADKKIQKGQRVIHPAICGKCEGNKE
ncbi:hypothetical protein BBbe_06270 [Bartonella bovis 91-4]|uniref:DUF192 domain-containing protein n=2 Tax=Bartonella bovis TaxID=155194 RepID=N6UIL6_9HYPH|nr:hypothetical protein BBbe_06270 [Bartonella bovis 91-4]